MHTLFLANAWSEASKLSWIGCIEEIPSLVLPEIGTVDLSYVENQNVYLCKY